MNQDCALIVFAKAPVPGYVKTRLARAIGPQAAAHIATRMLNATLEQAIAANIGQVELCCAPDKTHPAFTHAAERYGVQLSLQGEGNLGMRMDRALQYALQSYKRVLLIGTDAPELGAAHLRDAAQLLLSQAAVFAPASDGGYVLVGLSQALPTLFEDIAWSTSAVMQQTRERLAQLGISCKELPIFNDIDEAEDLQHVPQHWLIEEK
jgi:rSAM/selenodomain-associated transferase 1